MEREQFKKILDDNNIQYNKLIGIKNSFDIELNRSDKWQDKANYKKIDNTIKSKRKEFYNFSDKIVVGFEF